MARKPIVAGNWKMYKTAKEAVALVKELRSLLDGVKGVEVAVAPPFTALSEVSKALAGSHIALAAQNVYYEEKGAFTGEISPGMLLDLGVKYVLAGHSERRTIFNESNDLVNRKTLAILKAGMKPIVCVGESAGQRKMNQTFTAVDEQLQGALANVSKDDAGKIVIAYEPVWAIGTGENATPAQAQEVHAFIRAKLALRFGEEAAKNIRIQYGGSVKPDNANELMSQTDIDGALVGGASLSAESFEKIVKAKII